MGKIFGLSLFINFIVAGIILGQRRVPPTPRDVRNLLLYLFLVYLGMGFFLSTGTEFLRPE